MEFSCFDKVNKNVVKAESIILKTLIKRKNLLIQILDKDNAVVITERTNYLKGIKSHFLDSGKFMQLPIHENKSINYIMNLENMLKTCFKVLSTLRTKFLIKHLMVFI